MINFINNWAESIIIAVIISTIIEMIMPEGSIKKYVRTVIGAYIIFAIISPVITKITGKEIIFNSFEIPKTEVHKETTINTNAYIESIYIKKIEQDIKDKIEEKGYKVNNMNIEIITEEENYGSIKEIVLHISKEKRKNEEIELVDINIKQDIKEVEIIDINDIKEIKEFLMKTYGTENIIINENA